MRDSGYAAYDALPGVRWSTLAEMEKSPKHYLAAVRGLSQKDRKETKASFLGRAIHCLVLEGRQSFDLRWAVFGKEKADRRTTDWKKFVAANPDSELLTAAEGRRVRRSAEELIRHEDVVRYLHGAREKVITWRDEESGLQCKARIDLLTMTRLLDLKTTGSLDPRDFARTASKLGYHCQMAMYMMGLRANRWQGEEEPVILGVEQKEPFDVVPMDLPIEAMAAGRRQVRRLLNRVAECEAKGEWPGRQPRGRVRLELQEWVFDGMDDELDDSGIGGE